MDETANQCVGKIVRAPPIPITMAEFESRVPISSLRAKGKMIPKDTRYEWISFTRP